MSKKSINYSKNLTIRKKKEDKFLQFVGFFSKNIDKKSCLDKLMLTN